MILEREDFNRRNVLKVVGAFALAGAALYAYPRLERRYDRWRHRGSIEQVRKFTAAHDVPNAMLAIKSALSDEPSNTMVWRMAADFAEQLGDPESVHMRQQVVALDPSDVADWLALARTALRFKNVLIAREALESVPEAERSTVEYRRTAAALAVANGHPAEAAALLTTAIANKPGDAELRLERASLSLRYGAPAIAASAVGEMRALADHADTRVAALRELAADALRKQDRAGALAYADALNEVSTAFADALLRANILLSTNQAPLGSLLAELQGRSVKEPQSIPELVGWMMAMNQTAKAAEWLASLPAELQAQAAVKAARANCAVALNHTEEARALIADGAFGRIPPDVVQLVFAARVLRDHDRPALARNAWDEAIRLCPDLPGLRVLHRLALTWRWSAELNAVLLAIATKHEGESWAFQSLAERYHRALDTANLKSVYSLWREAEPGSVFVEGNSLFLKLLTEPTTLASPTKARAAQLYAAQPANAFLATTHAFALSQSGKYGDAMAVFDKLSPVERRAPQRALYVALALNGVGRRKEAAEYLGLVRAASLMPEERELLRAALSATESGKAGPDPAKATEKTLR